MNNSIVIIVIKWNICLFINLFFLYLYSNLNLDSNNNKYILL